MITITSYRSLAASIVLTLAGAALAQTPPASAPATRPVARSDANGNPIRVAAKTGHVSNYDEAKVGYFTLPDPLTMASGQVVMDADTWNTQRRAEIIQLYQDEIYGHVPATAPKVTFEVTATDPKAMNGAAIKKQIVGHIGPADGPTVNLALYIPANATGPVPVVLSVSFFGDAQGGRGGARATAPATAPATTTPARGARGGGAAGGGEPIADILAHGYAYAIFRYTDFQPDNATTATAGIEHLALAPGQAAPAPNEWGTISCWAWGISRIVDYLATDSTVDAKRIAIVGHSRLGKTVLWAGAQDQRIALVFSSCGGELGSALARRDYGETVDDMAQNFPWQFAGNLQKYPGRWNDMPVDAHMLIALNAPRPVLITGGTGDQWSDPRGEFEAEVAAGPIWTLLGKKDLGTTTFPAPDSPLLTGDLAYHYHTGPHAITASDWKVFLQFADAHLKPTPAQK